MGKSLREAVTKPDDDDDHHDDDDDDDDFEEAEVVGFDSDSRAIFLFGIENWEMGRSCPGKKRRKKGTHGKIVHGDPS